MLPAWAAALIVAVALFLVAGILALVGQEAGQPAVPPVPEATVRSVRADVDTVAAAVKDRGRA